MSWACYLARPIDAAPDDLQTPSVGWVKDLLVEAGAQVYDPAQAMLIDPPDGNPFAAAIHDAALRACDGVLAIVPDGASTIGVPMEIERAAELGKPVVVLGGEHARRSTVLAHRGVDVRPPEQAQDAVEALADYVRYPLQLLTRAEGETTAWWSTPADAIGTRFFMAVAAEIRAGVAKHPRSNDPEWTTTDRWFAITIEEFLEAALAIVQRWNDVYHTDPEAEEPYVLPGDKRVMWSDVQHELVQTAAMAARLWTSIKDREEHG